MKEPMPTGGPCVCYKQSTNSRHHTQHRVLCFACNVCKVLSSLNESRISVRPMQAAIHSDTQGPTPLRAQDTHKPYGGTSNLNIYLMLLDSTKTTCNLQTKKLSY